MNKNVTYIIYSNKFLNNEFIAIDNHEYHENGNELVITVNSKRKYDCIICEGINQYLLATLNKKYNITHNPKLRVNRNAYNL